MNSPAPLRLLVVDVETTGLNARACSILQIGAVWLIGGPEHPACEEFSTDCRAFEGAVIEPKALEVNGCSEGRVSNPVLSTEGEALADFLTWLNLCMGDCPGQVILAGLNPSHDRAFLNEAHKRAGLPGRIPFPHRTLDLHSLAVSYALTSGAPVPDKGLYTDAIYELLEMPPEPRPHVAIAGARAEAEAFRVLLGLPSLFDRWGAVAAGVRPCGLDL